MSGDSASVSLNFTSREFTLRRRGRVADLPVAFQGAPSICR